MARIRTIKPEFWTDGVVVECSPTSRLLFIGLWNFADDYGVIEAVPIQIKMRVFPNDDIEVLPLLGELLRAGLVVEYEVDGKFYLKIRNFEKHQRIEKKSKTRHPLPDQLPTTTRLLDESSRWELVVSSGSRKVKDQIQIQGKKFKPKFVPPTIAEVSEYCAARQNNVDPQRWHAYYTANGWKVGRNKMENWKAAIVTWEKGA